MIKTGENLINGIGVMRLNFPKMINMHRYVYKCMSNMCVYIIECYKLNIELTQMKEKLLFNH